MLFVNFKQLYNLFQLAFSPPQLSLPSPLKPSPVPTSIFPRWLLICFLTDLVFLGLSVWPLNWAYLLEPGWVTNSYTTESYYFSSTKFTSSKQFSSEG